VCGAVNKYFTGIPLQFTTDCGSETTQLYGLVKAIQLVSLTEILILHFILTLYSEITDPDFDPDNELPAHVYLRSIHNISIEHSWLRLRLDFGDNAIAFFDCGQADGIYNPNNPQEQYVTPLKLPFPW